MAHSYSYLLTPSKTRRPIRNELEFGIFFEDLNHAADGGLYGELLRNRDFEYTQEDNPDYNSMTGWELVGELSDIRTEIVKDQKVNLVNPSCLRLITNKSGCGVRNTGYNDGIYFQKGAEYRFLIRCRSREPQSIINVVLRGENGEEYGAGKFHISDIWQSYEMVISSGANSARGRLEILLLNPGEFYISYTSLFPVDTFMKRRNGLRSDLSDALLELHPAFMRFPGGCLVHCGSLNAQYRNSMYRWKNTLGDVEQRPARSANWGTHQTLGLGYFEYFQFCEDIKAKPLPVIPGGFDPHTQTGCAFDQMQEWIDEAMDLIEFANGDTDSYWGKIRAKMGHPEPFGLKYLAIGNEEQGEGFFERFEIIHNAIRSKYPEIKLIGSAGPFIAGEDYERGWDLARKLHTDYVDEHYYNAPEWFISNHYYYDSYDSNAPKVFLGEYASEGNTWKNALAEASYMIGLERNADKVGLACYAPLLCNIDYVNWKDANLIWFDQTRVLKTPNYFVQKLFMEHQGTRYLPYDLWTDYDCLECEQNIEMTGSIVLSTIDSRILYQDFSVWSGEDIQLIQLSDGELDTTQMKECGIVLANNYTISFRFCQLSEHGAGVRISFAIKDNENYMQLSLGDWNKSNNKLDQFINGKSSCLGQRNFHLEPRRMYRVKIDVHGAIAEIFVDDSFCYKVDAISQIAEPLYYSVQSNNNATEYIIKAANISDASKSFTLSIPTQKSMSGTIYSMGGYQLEAENTMEEPERIGIRTQEIFVDCGEIYYTMQEYSVCVIHVLQDC